ncbi:MAG: hypothetical protein LBE33_07725 [Zoogloeaceae bacterium]|jgi:hypothetical protein|nr:hypothetical protein [Zoogloeaceae bacterium]
MSAQRNRGLAAQPVAHHGLCGDCRHWLADPAALEERMAGMRSFGSAYSAVIAASRLCTRHDCWSAQEDTCDHFEGR